MSQKEPKPHSPESIDKKSGFDKIRIIKNAFANILRGGSTALITILLPPFLTKVLTNDEYGTWLLILQLSTYVSFLDFGIQTAIGRFVAYATELKDFKQRNKIVSTALALLIGMGCLALVGLFYFTWRLPQIFSSMPQSLHQDAQLALLLVGGSLSISLPFSAFGGIFIGIQRYDVSAWIIGLSRLIGGMLTIVAAYTTHSIVWMAVCTFLINLGASLGQYLAYKKVASEIKILPKYIQKEAGKEIINYCFGISVWNLGMLLVSGLDTTIVGFFDYKSVIYYTLAVSLTNFVIQLQGSIFSAMMPAAASLGARGDARKLGELLSQSTRAGMLILLITGLPLILWSDFFIKQWIGSEYVSNTSILLQILVVANIIRLAGLPYATLMIALGHQRLIILSPLLEGGVNFTCSVILTSKIGAIGAAVGTLIGSFISLIFHFTYNMSRTVDIEINRRNLLTESIIFPCICTLPFIATYGTLKILTINSIIIVFSSMTLSLVFAIFLAWKFSLTDEERSRIALYIYKIV
jgi:O-antigen/teichoic acid export membrane protein